MVGKVVHTSAAELARYHDQHLSNGDYHSEEGGLKAQPILKADARFRAFAELDISRLSGRKLRRPRKSERCAIEFAY
jgi:hypothetical protein